MEEQIITMTIKTSGEKCQLTDAEICHWYENAMRNAMNCACGTPEISVQVKRSISE